MAQAPAQEALRDLIASLNMYYGIDKKTRSACF